MSKAVVEVIPLNTMFDRAQSVAQCMDAGGVLPEADYYLGYQDAAQLFAAFTPERCRLLDELKSSGAQSIYALTKRLGRSYNNVHRDVQALMEQNLIVKNDDEVIHVPWDSVEIRLTLGLPRAA